MKKRIFVLTMCMFLLFGALTVAATPSENEDTHSLKDGELLSALGFSTASGVAADVASAEIIEGKLRIVWGETQSYPVLLIDAVPDNMTKYTVKMDISSNASANTAVYMVYARINTTVNASIGFRVGEFNNNNWGSILSNSTSFPTIGNQFYIFGQNMNGADLSGISNTPAAHTFSVSVDSEGAHKTVINVDGVNLPAAETSTAVFSSSIAGFSGYKGREVVYDNIVITNNLTDTVVYENNFEDHSYSSDITYIDEHHHGFKCSCGTYTTEDHVWDAGVEIDDPDSCTTKKSMKYTCTVCGGTKIVPNPHTPGEQTKVDATCTEDGYTETKCTVCGEVIEHTVIEHTGHSYGLWTIVKEATETEDGERQRVCSVCGDIESKVIPKTGTGTVTETTAAQATVTEAAEKKGCGSSVAVYGAPIIALTTGVALSFGRKKRRR